MLHWVIHGLWLFSLPRNKNSATSHSLEFGKNRTKKFQIRCAIIISRRAYSVPGPNSLWHIDGHHSLVRWGFVIHGAIDGFSRLITFLQCLTNNRSETVKTLFLDAIQSFGLPSRVRTNHGGENIVFSKQ